MHTYLKLLFCLILSAVAQPLVIAEENTTNRLNVLFISIDDLRTELGCYGADHIKSPAIDSLAKNGILFSHAYCQQGVCNPSRASMLTGLRPDTIKVWDLPTNFRTFAPDVVTLPQHFKNSGYLSQGMGKIYHVGHGNHEDEASWSVPHQVPERPRYADSVTEKRVKKMKNAEKLRKKECEESGREYKKIKRNGPATEMADVPDNAYKDGATADLAIETLQKIKDETFFLAVGFSKPHTPFCAPKKYWDLYDPSTIEVPSQEVPLDSSRYALSTWGELRAYEGIPKEGCVSDDTARRLIHGYYACISYVDAQVGRLLAELDRLDLRKNTVVVLWSDHGFKLGTYGAWCKHSNYELDTKAPFIISQPKDLGNGKVVDALVEFVDIYPTLAELCGLDAPAHSEGTSMVPLLENPDARWEKAAFSQYPRGKDIMGYSVRQGKWRYTEWTNIKTGKVEERELYDHSKSDIAVRNRADSPEHKTVVDRLTKVLDGGQGWRAFQP